MKWIAILSQDLPVNLLPAPNRQRFGIEALKQPYCGYPNAHSRVACSSR
jgi:hypothetical protein